MRPLRDQSHSHSSRDLVLLALAALLFFGVCLGQRDLWNPNEPSYGRATVEMFERGDWLIPRINGQVFAEKPILYYWSALAISHLQGAVDEFSLRVPTALAAVIGVLLTYLLVLPYAGRRRALLAAALFATQFQVFWAARAIQMDVLVLGTTLGALVPLTRMLDFGLSPRRAWAYAGLASGLGFAAKGPVALVIPGLAILLYALSDRRLLALVGRGMWSGGVVLLLVGAPWYVLLWLNGETDMLHEVLVRQNFSRFSEAWDHKQPWWYFLEYVWIDYAPWALLLPAAWLARPDDPNERRLARVAWIWLIGTIAFFSLSDSKRAPYILPVAPAIAVLAALVVDRWSLGNLPTASRRAAVVALGLLGLVLTVGGIYALVTNDGVPEMLTTVARTLGLMLLITGITIVTGLVVRQRRPALAPMALLVGFVTLYMTAATWALPAVDPLKSSRVFSVALERELSSRSATLAAYGLWRWRAGYAYYLAQEIPNLNDTRALEEHWRGDAPLLLTEARYREARSPQKRTANDTSTIRHLGPPIGSALREEHEVRAKVARMLPDAELILRHQIGSRVALLYARKGG